MIPTRKKNTVQATIPNGVKTGKTTQKHEECLSNMEVNVNASEAVLSKIEPSEQRAKFFECLFAGMPNTHHLNVWRLAGKSSTWFTDWQAAAASINDADHNVYVSVGLSATNKGEKRRITKVTAAGMVACCIDIDIAGPGRGKTNLPPDMKAAMAIVESFPLPPTMVIYTGAGVQGWWVLDHPWIFDTPEDRKAGAEILQRFGRTFQLRHSGGFQIDSTHSAEHVFRVPGTLNHKPEKRGGPPLPVVIHSMSEKKYSLIQLDAVLLERDAIPTWSDGAASTRKKARRGSCAASTLMLTAEPDPARLEALLEIDEHIKATWMRNRPDLPDTSQSGFDMALANFAVGAGWTDEEIGRLLIAFRRRHKNNPEKIINHPSYLSDTITKARKGVQKSSRSGALGTLSRMFGLTVTDVIKWNTDRPSYTIQTDRGAVQVPTTHAFIRPEALRVCFADHIGMYLKYSRKTWDVTAQALLDAQRVEDIGEDSRIDGWAIELLREWLGMYDCTAVDVDSVKTDHPTPYVDDRGRDYRPAGGILIDARGRLLIHPPGFWVWATRTQPAEGRTFSEIKKAWKVAGLKPGRTVYFKTTTRSYWTVPSKIYRHVVHTDED